MVLRRELRRVSVLFSDLPDREHGSYVRLLEKVNPRSLGFDSG